MGSNTAPNQNLSPRSRQLIRAQPRPSERRRQRSPHQLQAVNLQLEYVARRICLEVVVLCDDLGDVVACVGPDALVSALAEQAPWLVHSEEWELQEALSFLWEVRPNIRPEHFGIREVEVAPGSDPLYLCAIGDSPFLRPWLDHAARGVDRILNTAIY